MKAVLIKIKNKIFGLVSFKKINPHNHWKKLLYIFFTMIVLLILFSLYLLYGITKQQVFQITPSNNESPSLVNEKLLKKVNESFDKKVLKTKEIKEGQVLYKDPSLK